MSFGAHVVMRAVAVRSAATFSHSARGMDTAYRTLVAAPSGLVYIAARKYSINR